MVQLEFGAVQIHALALVRRILGHGVTVGPHLREQKNKKTEMEEDVGYGAVNMPLCLKQILWSPHSERGQACGCPGGAWVVNSRWSTRCVS